MIRNDAALKSPVDTIADEDGGLNGNAMFSRPSKTSINLSRPTGSGYDTGVSSGWVSKNNTGSGSQRDKGGFTSHHYSFGQDDSSFPSDLEKDDQNSLMARMEKQQYARAGQRTIVAKNLSDRATHKDIVDIIRGGAVLDIFLRTNDRSVSVSFVEESAAQNFMSYAKRNDIYIHGKRVSQSFNMLLHYIYSLIQLEFAWNDRQFILPGHVANKIGIGATRNLIIRGVHANITEDRLRDDLDHIHNLVVINISFENGDAHVSLNSIHNSLFARTCMMSRVTYKGMRIEWYPDECAQPLPKTQHVPKKEIRQPPPKKQNPIANRFQMLNMDGTEDGTEDGSDDDAVGASTVLTGFSPMNHRSPWNVRTVAA